MRMEDLDLKSSAVTGVELEAQLLMKTVSLTLEVVSEVSSLSVAAVSVYLLLEVLACSLPVHSSVEDYPSTRLHSERLKKEVKAAHRLVL